MKKRHKMRKKPRTGTSKKTTGHGTGTASKNVSRVFKKKRANAGPHITSSPEKFPLKHAGPPAAKIKKPEREYAKTGISGLDALFEKGIPKGHDVLVAGGAGSGKTIMCLQILANACKRGEKCLYMSFEESEERLREHMEDFGWDAREFEKKGLLVMKRFGLFDIARSIDALLEKSKGDLMIEVNPVILPDNFSPQWVVVDSLTAIASSFSGKNDTYRSYIEQLFRFFESKGSNTFLISETKEDPSIFSTSGVEEFLADGVIVLYNLRRGNTRENAIEVLKMRGTKHQKRIIAMQILDGKGIEIYPEQEVFGEIK